MLRLCWWDDPRLRDFAAVAKRKSVAELLARQKMLVHGAESFCRAMLQNHGISLWRPLRAGTSQHGRRSCCKKEFVRLRDKCSPLVMATSAGVGNNSSFCCCNESGEESSMNQLLVELRNGRGPGDGKISFPASWSARRRRRAHEIATRLGLGHVSCGQGSERTFTAWRLSVTERLSELHKLLDLEETASKENVEPVQSWRILEAQGTFLHNALITEREPSSFGKERWILQNQIEGERAGNVTRFAQRARPGTPICLAERDSVGNWVAAKGEPPGRVAWSRGKKICFVFDHPPTLSEEIKSADFLMVPDSFSFQRMRSVIRDYKAGEKSANPILHALLGSEINFSSNSISSPMTKIEDQARIYVDDGMRNLEVQEKQLFDNGLNLEQRAAVNLCTDSSDSPVVLIHGPFGTGKTRTLVEVIRQHVKAGRRVLVCAASNAAVDNLVNALLTADSTLALARAGVTERVSTSVADYTMDSLQDAQPEAAVAKRLRREAYAMQLTAEKWTRAAGGREKRASARKESNALLKDARRLDHMTAVSLLRRTKVLCGTLTGFASALRGGDSEGSDFDCAVIDEASQAITPAILLVLPYLRPPDKDSLRIPQVVMAGDHQQLPPTVLYADRHDKGGGLESTLFQELMERDGGGLGTRIEDLLLNQEEWEIARSSIVSRAHALITGGVQRSESVERSIAGDISVALRQQYRMPPQLMAFPSAAFYGGQLLPNMKTADEVSDLQRGVLLEVIDTAGAGFEEERTEEALSQSVKSRTAVEAFSTSNPDQAALTARVVRELLLEETYFAKQIGVVTPYSAQVMVLRQLLVDEVEAGLEIDSVDAYQGREKEVIVVDVVRSNADGAVGFLSDSHRLNVALTRARHKLIIIGDSATLSTDPVWAVFFEWVCDYRESPMSGIRYRSAFELPPEGGW